MEQSLGHDAVSLSLKEYVHSVKPITVEKVRRQRPADSLDEKKIAKLRSLLGALAWPATQAPPNAVCCGFFAASIYGEADHCGHPRGQQNPRFAKECAGRLRNHVYGDLTWSWVFARMLLGLAT